ncbi:hypothetical protein [Streptomyces sp. NPDC046197]|uniref:hypothetical protein n=1 Tax=Streptomyces sp. NPDC046197 TaxID=3154337 RepID=UPI0034092194
MTSPPRKRPQRRSEIPRGPQQDTGLQQIRDTLPPAAAPARSSQPRARWARRCHRSCWRW